MSTIKPYTCEKCYKTFKNEKALKQHQFMMHSHAGSKLRKTKRAPWGSKTKKNKVMTKSEATSAAIAIIKDAQSASKSLAFCPCCGIDLRKVAVAMTM